MDPFTHLSSSTHFEGRVLTLKSDRIQTDRGRIVDYEYIDYPDVVVILGVTPRHEIVMARQYRPAIQQVLLELPAGKIDPNEDHLAAAQREFEEETGYMAQDWQLISEFYSAPGFCTEYLKLYLAKELSVTQTRFDEDESIETELIPISKIGSLIQSGDVVDAKTLIGLSWALLNTSRLYG